MQVIIYIHLIKYRLGLIFAVAKVDTFAIASLGLNNCLHKSLIANARSDFLQTSCIIEHGALKP